MQNVPVNVAKSCESCICAPIRETCLLGPDSAGNFATTEVDSNFAETCPRETCTCTSHANYQMIANKRLSDAVKVFEIKIAKKFESGIDPSKVIDGDKQAATSPAPTTTAASQATKKEPTSPPESTKKETQPVEKKVVESVPLPA